MATHTKPTRLHQSHILFFVVINILMLIVACSGKPSISPIESSAIPKGTPASPSSPTDVPVTFEVHVPLMGTSPQEIRLNLLDEVTGLALNALGYPMENKDVGTYTTSVQVKIGSLLKYRYSLDGEIYAVEYNSLNQQVRYRMVRVDGPTFIEDIVPAWSNSPFNGSSGTITGRVIDHESGQPVPGLMAVAAGLSTVTTSDGTFIFETVPVGTHNLVVFALDGAYQPFQQGVKIVQDGITPAEVLINPASRVNITLNVMIPKENVVGLPVRLAGNLLQTGNTFSDLRGGVNTLATRMPLLTQVGENQYSITLQLFSGTDFRYKYTLGDGFWNGEQTLNGSLRVRQLMVPDHDATIEDQVDTWRFPDRGQVTFDVYVPSSTPAEDYISIQFNPYGWMEPIPMWSLGNHHWLYILYSPLNLIDQFSFRICRNDQCGIADDNATPGENPSGIEVRITSEPQVISKTVDAWTSWQPISEPTSVAAAEITPKDEGFIAGIELQPMYHPSYQSRFPSAFQAITSINSQWVIFTPTWMVTESTLPNLMSQPGLDPSWADLSAMILVAQQYGLKVALYPTTRSKVDVATWWEEATRNPAWWDAWFANYRTFILHHADLAQQANITAMIIGGEWSAPALPEGILADGSPSGVPESSVQFWLDLVSEVKSHFNGQIFWATDIPSISRTFPEAAKRSDQIYLQWSEPLSDENTLDLPSWVSEMGRILDEDILPWQTSMGLPLILAVGYPSATGASTGCIDLSDRSCLSPSQYLLVPNHEVEINLQEQVNLYNAVFAAINTRPWVNGIVSRGFYPAAIIQDNSASIYGKPAQDVVWYWFQGFKGG